MRLMVSKSAFRGLGFIDADSAKYGTSKRCRPMELCLQGAHRCIYDNICNATRIIPETGFPEMSRSEGQQIWLSVKGPMADPPEKLREAPIRRAYARRVCTRLRIWRTAKPGR